MAVRTDRRRRPSYRTGAAELRPTDLSETTDAGEPQVQPDLPGSGADDGAGRPLPLAAADARKGPRVTHHAFFSAFQQRDRPPEPGDIAP